MRRVRPALVRTGLIYREETDRAPNNVWSRRMWGWAAAQPTTHSVFLQDDLLVSPDFWSVVEAMVRAVPNRVINLIANHPMSQRAQAEGHAWFRMCEALGAGYIVPTPLLAAFLDSYDRLDPAFVAASCEDYLLSRWVCSSGRKVWCPVPTVIQTRSEIATTNPRISYPFRQSYLAWDDPRVAGKDLTSVSFWKPAQTPPDFGHAVSEDSRYPRGNRWSTPEVLAEHRRSSERSAPRLRVYPPASAGLNEGLAHVLAGSYDVPGLRFDTPPRIGDLGGNVGSFSVWASGRFPGAKITAYEPSPESASYCRQNLIGIGEVVEVAVVGADAPSEVVLYEGRSNTGQRSIHQLGEQKREGVRVKTLRARELPPFDVLKLDTEGCEVEILRDYLHLSGVRALMLEWHRKEDYDILRSWLPKLGFDLVRDDAKGSWVADRNLIFLRKRQDPIIECPGSDMLMVAEQKGYRLEQLTADVRTIVDVGAHVGTFCLEALRRWPKARVLAAFEPHPETHALLVCNTRGRPVEPRNAAVVHPRSAETMRLYEGVNGRHECSLRSDIRWAPDDTNPEVHVSQRFDRWVDVATFDASELPLCDMLKVDCEGSELEILSGYPHLGQVKCLLVECHAVGGDIDNQIRQVHALARAAGLRPIDRGPVVRFVR